MIVFQWVPLMSSLGHNHGPIVSHPLIPIDSLFSQPISDFINQHNYIPAQEYCISEVWELQCASESTRGLLVEIFGPHPHRLSDQWIWGEAAGSGFLLRLLGDADADGSRSTLRTTLLV